MIVRDASEAELAGILAIYNHAVAHTTAIWNDVLVDLDNRRAWWRGDRCGPCPRVLNRRRGRWVCCYESCSVRHVTGMLAGH